MTETANADVLPQKTLQGPKALHTLIDSIPALVAYIDCNMVVQYCNQPFKSWFSLNADVSGESFPVIAGDELFFQLQKHMGKVLVGQRANFQISVSTEDGIQYLDATLSPDFDHKKRVVGFIFHSADVTEKNRTERALKDYFENASIGLHWVDANGIIIWANPAELKMLGYTRSEYVGHHISEFHADKLVIADILNRLFNRKAIRNQEADLVCKDGSVRHVTINSSALWEDDKFIHTRCFTVDMTEQRLAAQAVKESEERFKMMANLVPLIIFTTDETGSYNFLNTKWSEITGKSSEHGLGEGWMDLIHPDDKENIRSSWTKSFDSKKPFEGRFRLLNSSGEYQTTYSNCAPRYNHAGQFSGFIGILQDVSADESIKLSLEKIVLDRTGDLTQRNADLKKAEKELQNKNKELEEINNQLSSFAHIASHDLQEPLRKIQTFSSRLFELEGKGFSEKGREFYHKIYEASHRMKNLIQDLLAYSRSNDNSECVEPVDLNTVLNEVLSELEIKISEKTATIVNHGLPTLNIVRFQFYQLFLNLVSNGLKFSKDEMLPEIVIDSEIVDASSILELTDPISKTYYHISLSDNGIGFSPQERERIFQMFHRLHNTGKYEGTGIGLAICRKIIENHNGIIVADAEVNKGATFHIYLPVI
jgi:PAS domain S-box-containing protein